ncbi:hydroxymethylglutaryl-CoA reductase [Limnobacter humi]|uniref:hydroxymethylglutaryl-CoA reductase (NADPH) n=1 Tax=Limnobacter humi TaxID=1778671 RepID=A0ABT1WHC2_9BURK|nr:hydroxymethylglutaryl-CoA reductase [Limnobacter humi]MCQ8896436.1 hydroxymethylglutaryl-CoA reductase [Limnobacter humi]
MSIPARQPIPRLDDNYSEEAASTRRAFLTAQTGASLPHTAHYSLSPDSLRNNTENFIGVVQMPVGVAGPVLINGEHAQGWFYVPMATTEGTLVASYSRGMRIVSESGGVKTTVVEEFMQRAPLFEFEDARAAKRFLAWVDTHEADIRQAAESTTAHGKLMHIQRWQIARMVYTRFNYTTGDAAGQNMCGKATHAAAQWMLKNSPETITHFALSGATETDKKHSHMNLMHSRGKRVIAEAVIQREVLQRLARTTPEIVFKQRQRSAIGNQLAGSAYGGPHSANGIAALFIATGQDEANVVESHAGFVFMDLTADGNLYFSVTLPSVICATRGGGTGLSTQAECLALLGCHGEGKAKKLAEIVGATVLAGDLSLLSAIMADEWVSSHDAYGRNR